VEDNWGAAWAAALDELELSVDQAEQLLHDAHTEPLPEWHPPAIKGPPPPGQLERAHRLLERHLRVSQQLASAAAVTRRQLALTARMAENRPHESPVYVDFTA
jgi:hypothetical protein